MTTQEPVTPPPAPEQFSTGRLIGGLILSLGGGGLLAFFAGILAMSQKNGPIGFLIGMAPGAIFVVIGALMKRKLGYAQGLIIGGCVIALIGGACGAAMAGTSFR